MSFEKHLKETLNEQRTSVDAQKIWENVEPRLDEKKKRRGIVYWFLGSGALLTVAFLSWTFLFSSNNHNLKDSSLIPKSETKHSTKTISSTSNTNDSNFELDTYESTKIVTTKINQEKTEVIAAAPIKTKSSVFKKIKNTEQNTSSTITIKAAPNNSLSTAAPGLVAVNTQNTTNNLESNSRSNANSTFESQNLSRKLSELLPLAWAKLNRLSFERKKKNLQLKRSRFLAKAKIKSKELRKWNMILMAGMGKTTKTSHSHNFRYEFYRNTYEEALENLSIDLLFQRKLKGSLSLLSGLSYHLQTERFEWQGNYREKQNGDYIEAIYWPSPIESITISSFGEYETKSYRQMLKYNHYHFVSVPFYLGYSLGGNNWKISLHPGFKLDLLLFEESDQLTSSGNPVRKSGIKSALNFIPSAFISSEHRLNDRLHILGSVYYDVRSFSESDGLQKIDHKYQNVQFKLGLKLNI